MEEVEGAKEENIAKYSSNLEAGKNDGTIHFVNTSFGCFKVLHKRLNFHVVATLTLSQGSSTFRH
jgi:hypothetical protein